MASQRSVEIKVGIFVCISLFVGAAVIFIVGSANQRFDKSVELYSSFGSVSGLKMGSPVRLSGLKIGVVELVRINRRTVELHKLVAEYNAKISHRKAEEKKRKEAAKRGVALPPYVEPLPAYAKRMGCHPPLFPERKLRKYSRLKATGKTIPKQLEVSFICVRMKVKQDSLEYIRVADSVAMVKGKGLLGDSLIEISMGVKGKPVTGGGFVQGITPKGLSDVMAEGGEVITKLKRSLARVEDILTQFSDPRLSNNLKGIVESINHIIGRVKTGPGLLHSLFYDNKLKNDVRRAVFQFQRLTTSLGNTLDQINWIMARAKRRGTLVHSLLISRTSGKFAVQLKRLILSTRRAIDSLRAILDAPRKPGTLLHKVLYEKNTSKIVTNLTTASNKLKLIMDRINQGKGTLGAIINDPTAFEDFKAILGQVKRSRVFKALIRFVIKRDDSVKGGRVVKPK